MEPIARVHDAGLVRFLAKRANSGASAMARTHRPRFRPPGRRADCASRSDGDVESRLGNYAFDTATPIVKGTWRAALAAVNTALTAAQAIQDGERAAFALARPPGHHASADVFGGYCYLNNIAIAAQWFVDQGLKPAILDVDYHHGNGTQSIFYRRSRRAVLFAARRSELRLSAFSRLRGRDAAKATAKAPTSTCRWPCTRTGAPIRHALATALKRIKAFGPDVLLVSLGLDTFENDPISKFKLTQARLSAPGRDDRRR